MTYEPHQEKAIFLKRRLEDYINYKLSWLASIIYFLDSNPEKNKNYKPIFVVAKAFRNEEFTNKQGKNKTLSDD